MKQLFLLSFCSKYYFTSISNSWETGYYIDIEVSLLLFVPLTATLDRCYGFMKGCQQGVLPLLGIRWAEPDVTNSNAHKNKLPLIHSSLSRTADTVSLVISEVLCIFTVLVVLGCTTNLIVWRSLNRHLNSATRVIVTWVTDALIKF